ncbi:hypothetical protein Xvie_01205 [Xenorhabdus vietnamensis]|uniref:Uncharacterized protein n=1 Tax=Xenorhabdus vietnamensis TaxID=351656 RepID=A0A1Y2SFG2_9GAMM|nr:hypothetical protein Xvie_01205 [Xenorhabdus vietnamensis]
MEEVLSQISIVHILNKQKALCAEYSGTLFY